MKHYKTVIFVILLSVVLVQANCDCKKYPFFGKASNWQPYGSSSTNGIYVDIDFSILDLSKTPGISTTLQCTSTCWTVDGVTSHYNVTNSGFRVYLRYTIP